MTASSFEVVGGVDELRERAVAGMDTLRGPLAAPSLDRRGQDSRARAAASPSAAFRMSAIRGWTRASCRFRRCTIAPIPTSGRSWFPGDFITESFPGQYRNWFYSLLVMSTVLENTPPFKTVLGHGTVRGEDGRPMHK